MFWQDKKVLVTGGCGFIGQYLVPELISAGALVTVVDNMSRGKRERLSGLPVNIIEQDLTDSEVAQDSCYDQEVVIHLASPVGGLYWASQRHYSLFSAATKLTLNVVDACLDQGVSRIGLVSSACAYASDCPVPMKETDAHLGPPQENSEGYGWSKRISELMAKWVYEEHNIPVAVFRPANTIGIGDEDDDSGHVIPQILLRIFQGQDPLVIYGSGQQKREFLHARDYARGAMFLTENYACADIVNLGSGDVITIYDLARKLLDMAGFPDREIVCDTTQAQGHAWKQHDLTKLSSLGFKTQVTLDEGLAEVVEDYRRRYAI